MRIIFNGWPLQYVTGWMSKDKEKYGFNPFSIKGHGRFGGWWMFKFGITIGKGFRDIILDLGIGSIRIQFKKEIKTDG